MKLEQLITKIETANEIAAMCGHDSMFWVTMEINGLSVTDETEEVPYPSIFFDRKDTLFASLVYGWSTEVCDLLGTHELTQVEKDVYRVAENDIVIEIEVCER